jgi:pilus assembly protein CpaF
VYVNGRRIPSQYGPLGPEDSIRIGQHTLRLAEADVAARPVQAAPAQSRSDTAATRNRHAAEAVHASRLMAERAQQQYQEEAAAAEPGPQPGFALVVAPDQSRKQLEFDWRQRIHARLLETMDLRRQDVSRMTDDQLRADVSVLIQQIMEEVEGDIPVQLDRALLARQVLDEAVGLGPLEELLADAGVSEIMVNSYDQIYIERDGRLLRHPLTFTSDRAVVGVIERIVAPLGRRIDESSPMVDARLKDGSRVNAIISPLALKGAVLTIRKFPLHRMNSEDLIGLGTVSEAMTEFLRVCVKHRKNIVVSGGTGSGKTTLLNILSNFIPSGERVITVEDAAELKLHHEHLIGLESRPANVEGKGAVLIRDLVRNTLRMRPDRIVIGECRGGEALDMLQAMNTGHEGSLTTLHANTPRDALARLETMVLMAGMELPLAAIREQIASAIQIVVQQTRFPCGTRIVTSITEVTGMESGKFQLQELFKFVNLGFAKADGATRARVRGYFTGCNMMPTFYDELQSSGEVLDIDIFSAAEAEARAHGR